jgi:hypothetical protein
LNRTVWIWILAVVATLGSAVWQRVSGPSYPIRARVELAEATVKGRLLRSHSTSGPLPISLEVSGGDVTGQILWRRYPTAEAWSQVPLVARDDKLSASLPAQPSAGKIEYQVVLEHGGQTRRIPAAHAAVARFRDDVPLTILILHILIIFCGMLWATRAGLEAIVKGAGMSRLTWTTFVLLAIGGLILGPVVQKYAFGAYWTGWPLGEDLTDNKLAVAVLLWLVAALRCRSGRRQGALRAGTAGRVWVLAAALVTLVIFAIPHSIHGSTLDYESMETISG